MHQYILSLQDLLYEYRYSVGNATKKLLYKGRDYQHYFYLPSGDPYDDYKGIFKRLLRHLSNLFSQILCCFFVKLLINWLSAICGY